MKYDIIFYQSRKTSLCEKALEKTLSSTGFSNNRTLAATTPQSLGQTLSESLLLCNLCIVVGGLSQQGDENLATVLSRVFANCGLTLSNMRKLCAHDSDDGYIIRYNRQTILALPDNPNSINALLNNEVLSYIISANGK